MTLPIERLIKSDTVKLRSPDQVMRLERMGSLHQSRLSFMRALLRTLKRENWTFSRPVWEIDANGVGRAVYQASGPRRTYSLIAFAHDLPDDQRSDRVIATAWDTTFCLYDGVPSRDEVDRLQQNVPKQEAGRIFQSELSLSRANRSARLWTHVVDRLAAGAQPDPDLIESVGYLMRTTAVYGSGKFGAADRNMIDDRPLMAGPFRAEMLSVYLTRAFVLDLVEHCARAKGGDRATVIEPSLRRKFGIGNSTGLGMAPFLINHPVLLHRWMVARETALARVRGIAIATDREKAAFQTIVKRARINARQWTSMHPIQIDKLDRLRNDLQALSEHLENDALDENPVWDRLYRWSEQTLSVEGQELLVSLMMEPYPDIVDPLAQTMDADEYSSFRIDGDMDLARMKAGLREHYSWACEIDFQDRENQARFWYVSEEKLEPRLGERFQEPGADYEQPLCIARDVADLAETLDAWPDDTPLADFLLACPQHRHSIRRLQIVMKHPYGEVRDNLIAATMKPIDLLRCKLSFFGATRFDPRSDRWVRICMYQNAPFPHELAEVDGEDWAYPPLEADA